MRASPKDQLDLLQLQDFELELSRIDYQLKTLPLLADLAKAERNFEDNRDLAIAASTQKSDIEEELKRSELDVEQVVERIKKDQKLLDSSDTSPKELEILINEIANLNRRKEELEEIELEIMVRIDIAVESQKSFEKARDEFAEEISKLTAEKDLAISTLKEGQKVIEGKCQPILSTVNTELLNLYKKIKESNGGVGAARLLNGKCDGCHLQINTIEIGRIASLAEDEIVRCEECRRILVRI